MLGGLLRRLAGRVAREPRMVMQPESGAPAATRRSALAVLEEVGFAGRTLRQIAAEADRRARDGQPPGRFGQSYSSPFHAGIDFELQALASELDDGEHELARIEAGAAAARFIGDGGDGGAPADPRLECARARVARLQHRIDVVQELGPVIATYFHLGEQLRECSLRRDHAEKSFAAFESERAVPLPRWRRDPIGDAIRLEDERRIAVADVVAVEGLLDEWRARHPAIAESLD